MIFLLLFLSVVHGQPCSDTASVELTNPQMFQDGTIFQDGVTYTRENVFAKNVSGTVKTFGCLCNVKRCFRKCCPIGSVLELLTKQCVVKPAEDILLVDGIDLHFFNTFTKKVGLASSHFAVMIGYPDVPGKFYREMAPWYIQECTWILGVLGFTAVGIAAGSLAAAAMSFAGIVAAGTVIAMATSMAMKK